MEVYGKGYRWDAEPYAMAFRRLLASAASVDQAAAFLKQNPTTTGNNLMVCDAAGGTGVLEITPTGSTLRQDPKSRYIYATNHFLSERSSGRRISTIRAILREGPAPTFGLARRLLLRTGDYSLNLQAMVFYPDRRALRLSAGTLPASRGSYVPLGASLMGLGIVPGKRKAILIGKTGELAHTLVQDCGFTKECLSHDHTFPEGGALEAKPEDLLFVAIGTGPVSGDREASLREWLATLPCLTIACDDRAGAVKHKDSIATHADVAVANATDRATSLCQTLAAILKKPPPATDRDRDGTVTAFEAFTALGERLKAAAAPSPLSFSGTATAQTVVFRRLP
jgi:hypothetical protein